jgi:hypothetical protein
MNHICNVNFKSKFAYINNASININDYLSAYVNKNKKATLKCMKGHELICVNGKIKTPHFRHKNSCDVGGFPMTEWHCEWQGNFLNTEIDFPKINDTQVKDRRADVLLADHNIVLEFQHSKIDYDEVLNRKNDYDLNNKKTLWIIDGNNTITVKNLDYCNRIFLEFITDSWKYKSFTCYEYIFIDINGLIYKVFPRNVKSNMIDVEQPIIKEDFIKLLSSNDKMISNIDIPLQCNLYIKQQGAGNGKTFGLIQMLESNEFEHYKYFIIVTKQHSAKYVIYKEFKDQITNGHLKYLNINDEKDQNKKYTISYTNNKTDSQCQLIVGTIDSLIYTLGNKNHTELNKFEGLVNSIVDGYIEQNNTKSINYNGINIKLNKEVCLICDETQDLTIDYAKAIIQIMRNKYIDSYIVGDKLQSLMNKENAFTYLMDNEFSYINKKSFDQINICRRFYHPKLVDFVNSVIPFDKYSLPTITPYKSSNENNDVVTIFTGKNIYATENDENKINVEVENIMEYYDKEVNNNNYQPNDFLFITPFTNKNPLVNAIETAINMYWNKKYGNNHFERYAIFHKSEEGTSINLSESENATRLVSIHTSKGDGRNVVFIIGLDEQSLIRFSNENNNLIYDSLLHVALTRMKKKLYIRIVENNDDICQRMSKYTHDNNTEIKIKPNLLISNKIKYQEIIEHLKTNNDFESLKNTVINDCKKLQFIQDEDKLIIDMGHHTIRYTSMMIYLYIKIIQNEKKVKDNEVKKQIQAKFIEVRDSPIYQTTKWQEYNNYIKDNKIALLKLSNNGRDYNTYYNIIYDFMNCIKGKIKGIFNDKINMLCPLESIILYFMTQVCRNGIYADITINELYNVIDIYAKSFNHSIKGHDECLCKAHFQCNQVESNSKIKHMNKYLLTHYEQINNMGKIYDQFLASFPKVSWLIDHQINLHGNNNDFKINRKFQLIGYDNENIFIMYAKPQLNNLNYNQTLIDSIFDTFLINNVKKPFEDMDEKQYNKTLKDYEKFNQKNIKTILFTLDSNDFVTLEWKDDKENLITKHKDLIVEKIKDKIISKYLIEGKHIYYFYKYCKDKLKDQKLMPEKTIKAIINEFKNDKKNDELPEFIFKFLYKLENKIDDCRDKKEKQKIINSFDDKDYFLDMLNDKIIECIEDFLGIDYHDEQDETIE